MYPSLENSTTGIAITQGDCTGFSTGLVRATIVSKDNSTLSEGCNIPSWVCWNAKKILEKMSATEEMKDLKVKITDTHTCTHEQNNEIKTMLTERQKQVKERRIQVEEFRTLNAKLSNANEQNEAIKASFNEHKTWRETWTNEVKSAITANFLLDSDQAIKLQKLNEKLSIFIEQEEKEPKSQHENPRHLQASAATPLDLTEQQQKAQYYSIQKLLDDKIQEVKLATKVNDSQYTRESWQGTVRAMYNSQKEQISGLKSMMERNENEVRSLKEMIEKLLKEKNSSDSPENTRKV